MMESQTSANISTKLERIAKQAREAPDMAFRTLAHNIDIVWLHEAYRRTRKDGAVGIDRQSANEYAANLEGNLQSLLDRAKSGTYRAPPVRRVHIPKGNGSETRPIGIPTFEDKVLQRAVAMVLEAIYEQDFLNCSYGFRPKRSAHQALADVQPQAVIMRGGWVLEIDIRKFFDSVEHRMLRDVLVRRVRDGVLLRLIGKWLNAGVLERGELSYPVAGTPQGGVISPILANIFLHEVLDTWFHREVLPRLSGTARLFRYADDAVLLFSDKRDAARAMAVLPKRFGRFGLTLHPDKTRLVDFRRPDRHLPSSERSGPGTFDLLGFTHFWGRSLSGKWIVKRRTAKDRFRRAIKRIAEWCKVHRHDDIRVQQETLGQKVQGHYQYYGITGNGKALRKLLYEVKRAWCKWLNRRSQRARMTWERMNRLLERYPLPPPRIVHPYSKFA
ncbi:group II intron reverse transcriptase/maturase [Polyangium jinanense]|uniref:Group II intron reverse transcriptase/maturase n=1 Tax=Polyangium jinanense TaxID=2829994 RepID=A0A9X3XGW2_9BACT|nr:group II intron reverse transcriptase/maturase [Polyangium jinanense]MDC3962193.1 group II intron reverse transcriptase/maturase [Polyangium jinanense]MDC3988858.1 group II intron reverse transcriptase/maturase [Polyangium jinanense]